MTDEQLIEAMASCPKCDKLGDDCGEHLPTWRELAEYWRKEANRATAALAKVDEMYHRIPKDSEPVGWQRRWKWPLASDPPGKTYQWEQCSREEATGHFERQPGYEYRPIFAPEKRHDD